MKKAVRFFFFPGRKKCTIIKDGKTGLQKGRNNSVFAPNVRDENKPSEELPLSLFPCISTTMTPKSWNAVAFFQTKLPFKPCLTVFILCIFHWGLYKDFTCIRFCVQFWDQTSCFVMKLVCQGWAVISDAYSSSTLHVIICCVLFIVVYTTLPNFSFMDDILKQMLYAWVISPFFLFFFLFKQKRFNYLKQSDQRDSIF